MSSVYCFMFMYMLSFVVVMGLDDWFLVWMGLEINMMSFLILVYRRYSLEVIESCLKYFFIQSMGSALFISMFYVNYYEVSSVWSIMLSYKIGVGPFFYWFPSLCSGIDWLSCYVLMIFQKILPLLLLTVLIHWFMWVMGLLSLMLGVMGSFNQSNIKQLMAYSSVHHLGWIYMIMMDNEVIWFMYLMLYSLLLMNIVILMIKGEIIDIIKMYISKKKLWFVLGMMSMAGLPPLLGFYLKWMALLIIVDISKLYFMMMVMVSVIMLYVYMRIVYDTIMGSSLENSWVNFNMMKYNMYIDMYSVFGTLLGIILGLYLLM